MKYWRGYLTAAILAFFTWALSTFAKNHTLLIDRVYPYVTRLAQTMLADFSAGVDFCLWQLVAVLLVVVILASLVIFIVMKWNLIQWAGWVLTGAVTLAFLHTAVYGLNSYAGPLAEDIRMEVTEYTLEELEAATTYYRDRANELSGQIHRDADGKPVYSDFETLANQAGEGFQTLVYEKHLAVFAGSTMPVKQLDWADMYTSMQITGFTMSLTGEAAVNPQIPVVSLPFTMCHEMAHRMCIAIEQDANFAAFLACDANESLEFQYSAYFCAYRYCYNALVELGGSEGAQRVSAGVGDLLRQDLADYREFFQSRKNDTAAEVANTVNDTYIKANGDERGVASYGDVADLLVNWYIQEQVLPTQTEDQAKFDPYDEDWVFATVPEPTEAVPNE